MRRELSPLRALLRARELDQVQYGLELLRARGEPAAWAEVLQGVGYSPRFADGVEDAGFTGPLRGPNAVYAITSLLEHARPDWVLQVSRLDLRAQKAPVPVSVRGLSNLPVLRQLHVHGAGPFLELEGELPALEQVALTRPVGLPHLRWLLRAPRLRRLELRHAPGLDLAVGLPVEELVLEDWSLTELGALHRMRSLKRLELHTPAVHSLAPLEALPLEELRVGRSGAPTDALEARGVRIRRA